MLPGTCCTTLFPKVGTLCKKKNRTQELQIISVIGKYYRDWMPNVLMLFFFLFVFNEMLILTLVSAVLMTHLSVIALFSPSVLLPFSFPTCCFTYSEGVFP